MKLNAKFPFLWRDAIEGRAKRILRNQVQPQLLSSYQGHRGSTITSLTFSENNQLLISSSRDKTVRLWDLSGQVRVDLFKRTRASNFLFPSLFTSVCMKNPLKCKFTVERLQVDPFYMANQVHEALFEKPWM